MTQREEAFAFFDTLQDLKNELQGLKNDVNANIETYSGNEDSDDNIVQYDEADYGLSHYLNDVDDDEDGDYDVGYDDGYDEKAMLTEKQAKKIIEAYEENTDLYFETLVIALLHTDLITEIVFNEYRDEINALINPLTREWALEHVVKKDKKYVLQTKESYDGVSWWYVGEPNSAVQFTTNPVFAYMATKEELEYWKSDAFEYVELSYLNI